MFLLLISFRGGAAEWREEQGYRYRPLSVSGAKAGFTLLEPGQTGVYFTNVLTIQQAADNEILLNGSGVAFGDVDNDGLCDIYLCRLSGGNVLYRNKGNFNFEDITSAAGVSSSNQFSTSAVLADLDNDRDLDLLVGSVGTGMKIFLNNGKGLFKDVTESTGVRSTYTSSSIALADIDGDGDLDIYHCTYRGSTIRNKDIKIKTFNGRRTVEAPNPEDYEFTSLGTLLEHAEPDQLFINKGGGKFETASWTSGRFLDEQGVPLKAAHRDWGLSVQFRDMNRDGAPDIYVCNDFFSPDRVWINDGKGNFRLITKFAIRHTSSFSMGVDFADINRDGYDDFFVTDMLSRSHARRMTQSTMTGPALPDADGRPQVSHNTLFLNRGDNTYAEIAQLSRVQASDWSWATVFMDVDLDGYEDILVTTGHYYDSQDADAGNLLAGLAAKPSHVERLDYYPKLDVPNYAFRNNGDLTFQETGSLWGFNLNGVSHGMALGDLDNDGDLDVVVNNLNVAVSIYRNNSDAPRVAVKLKEKGIGARLVLRGPQLNQSQEMISGGRYLSGDEQLRVFAAIGNKLEVIWSDGKRSELAVKPNHLYEIFPTNSATVVTAPAKAPWFKESVIQVSPNENTAYPGWERQPTLPRALSGRGPAILTNDFDKDGWTDLLYGSSKGELLQYRNEQGKGFVQASLTSAPAGLRDVLSIAQLGELVAVIYSSYETSGQGGALMTYQVLSNSFRRVSALALTNSEPGALAAADFDKNGDVDLFLGQFAAPGRYPEAGDSSLFLNRQGSFFYATNFPPSIGLVHAAQFADVDGDKDDDLIIASELGSIRVLLNSEGKLTDATTNLGLHLFTGFWRSLAVADFNRDGKTDILAGNLGQNISYSEPVTYYFGDWAENNTFGILEAREQLPLTPADVLGRGLPGLGERFNSYSNYARASVLGLLDGVKFKQVNINTLETSLFLNDGKTFKRAPLPIEAQFSPVNSIAAADFNQDGNIDIFLAQNLFAWREDYSRSDAGRGLLLLGDGKGGFKPDKLSGIQIYGQQRATAVADFNKDNKPDLAIAEKNGPVTIYLNNR